MCITMLSLFNFKIFFLGGLALKFNALLLIAQIILLGFLWNFIELEGDSDTVYISI